MNLKNFLLFLPAGLISPFAKIKRDSIDENLAEYIENNGLYHITTSEKTANKIIESGNIKASKSKINSYGSSVACMFAGVPELDNYIKNIAIGSENAVVDPTKVIHAVKINADKSNLANYKVRSLNDGAILHEGNCIVDKEKVESVQLVLDIIKDEQDNKKIGFRERTKEEIANDKDYVVMKDGHKMYIPGKIVKHIPSEELLSELEKYKEYNGYAKRSIIGLKDAINTFMHAGEIEWKYTFDAIKKNLKDMFTKRNFERELPQNPNDRVADTIEKIERGNIDTKKPVRDERYVKSIIEYKKKGINQEKISEMLPEICESDECEYLKQKINSMDMSHVKRKGIHGIGHSDRVAMLSIAIQQKAGITLDKRMQDILFTAAYYHDIGRILDSGPHAKRSAKKIDKININHLSGEQYSKEDLNILKAVIEAHEGSDKSSLTKVDKYSVGEEDKEKANLLITIIKDADALDRARLSSKSKAGVNPKYLRTDAAKGLVDFSLEFETLYEKTNNFGDIINYKKIEKEDKNKNFLKGLEEKTIPTDQIEMKEKMPIIREEKNIENVQGQEVC